MIRIIMECKSVTPIPPEGSFRVVLSPVEKADENQDAYTGLPGGTLRLEPVTADLASQFVPERSELLNPDPKTTDGQMRHIRGGRYSVEIESL